MECDDDRLFQRGLLATSAVTFVTALLVHPLSPLFELLQKSEPIRYGVSIVYIVMPVVTLALLVLGLLLMRRVVDNHRNVVAWSVFILAVAQAVWIHIWYAIVND